MSLNEKKAVDIMKKASGMALVESSIFAVPHGFIALLENKEELICVTDGACAFADKLECIKDEYKFGVRIRTAKVDNKNSHALRLFIKWTAPSACKKQASIGIEDEMGIALPILASGLADSQIKPVLTAGLDTVVNLADAMGKTAWQALAAGLTNSYGAEFSYATNENEIMNALLSGYTGIVLDCSNKIDNSVMNLSAEDVRGKYALLPEEFRQALENSYLVKDFSCGNKEKLNYEQNDLAIIALRYGDMVAYLQYMYNAYFKGSPWPVDFIVYLGKNNLSAKAHYLVANELSRLGVKLAALQLDFIDEDNLIIAKELEHKLRIEFNKDKESQLKQLADKVKCALDLRPIKGQSLVDIVSVLYKQDDPVLREVFTGKEVLDGDFWQYLPKIIEHKEVLKKAVQEYMDSYQACVQERVMQQREILEKFV